IHQKTIPFPDAHAESWDGKKPDHAVRHPVEPAWGNTGRRELQIHCEIQAGPGRCLKHSVIITGKIVAMDAMVATGDEENSAEYCAGQHTLHHCRVNQWKRNHCCACDCSDSRVEKTEADVKNKAHKRAYRQHQNE